MIAWITGTLVLTLLAALWLVAQFGALIAFVVIVVGMAFIIGAIIAFVEYVRGLYRRQLEARGF